MLHAFLRIEVPTNIGELIASPQRLLTWSPTSLYEVSPVTYGAPPVRSSRNVLLFIL